MTEQSSLEAFAPETPSEIIQRVQTAAEDALTEQGVTVDV
jgi:hypothetical protein